MALQHPVFVEDIQTICRMLAVCCSWRSAVQQSQTHGSAVEFSLEQTEQPLTQMPKVVSFVTWLPKYAHLLNRITLELPAVTAKDDQLQLSFFEAVDQLLAHSIGVACPAAASRTDSASSIQDRQCQRLGLHLISFKGINLLSPSVVAALPADSLQQLELLLPASRSWDSKGIYQRPAALPAALSRLTGLRGLNVASKRAGGQELALEGILSRCIEALSTLQHLTQLKLQMVDPTACNWQLLPPQVQQLHIWLQEPPSNQQDMTISLQQLTALQHMGLDVCGTHQPYNKIILPAQLRTFQLGKSAYEQSDAIFLPDLSCFNFSQLTQLEQLNVYGVDSVEENVIQQLQLLAGLESLQHIGLAYDCTPAAVTTAPTWLHLQRLRTLEVQGTYDDDYIISQQDLHNLMQGVAAVTTLTKLVLYFSADATGEVDICSHFTDLRALLQLRVCVFYEAEVDVCKDDALHLTSVTTLVKLDLSDFKYGVTDVAATALACSLTKLQHLSLRACGLETMAVVPVIARHLKCLTYLDLSSNCDLELHQLMLLTSLKSLQSVDADGVDDDEWDVFWQALRAPAAARL